MTYTERQRMKVFSLDHVSYCRFIIKTIQQIKSRIKEIKEDEYSSSLRKGSDLCDVSCGRYSRNVLLKFVRLFCLCPSEGHKYGGRKQTETYVIEFCYKKASSRLLRAHKHLYEYLFSYKDCSDCKISADVTFLTYVTTGTPS